LASIREVSNEKTILVRTLEVKRTLGRLRHKWGRTVKNRCEDIAWIQLLNFGYKFTPGEQNFITYM
jgi:hypothetical protein